MSSISAVSTSIPPYTPPPPVHPRNGTQDGDHDHGTEPTTTAASGTSSQASPGNPGSSGSVNLTA
jgi:hypothetical protein